MYGVTKIPRQGTLAAESTFLAKTNKAKKHSSSRFVLYLLLHGTVCACRVHVHNVHDLLVCILPYHATAEFVKVVQICNLDGTIWTFLTKMQETGATVPRSALVKICAKQKVRLHGASTCTC